MNISELNAKSLENAKRLYVSGDVEKIGGGTTAGLVAIYQYLFQDLYPFAGKIRTQNIAKENFRFANCLYLKEALAAVEKMPQGTFEEINY